jgi:hypothetical protein
MVLINVFSVKPRRCTKSGRQPTDPPYFRAMMTIEWRVAWKILTVIPAQAGIQRLCKSLKALDSRFRGNDGREAAKAPRSRSIPHGTHRAALPHIYVMGSFGDEVDYGHH